MTYQPLVYRRQGGNELAVESGGLIELEDGAVLKHSAGAVTQITSAATGVTLNKLAGAVTTVALTTAAAAEERFTVTNSEVAATDVISLSTTYDGAGVPMLSVMKVAAGAFDIVVTNVHATLALNAVMVINFVVHKCRA